MVHIVSKCPECGSPNIVTNTDGVMCGKCGLVLSERFYSGRGMIV